MTDDSLRTILVVDDEPIVRESLGRLLGESGYRVLTASSAREALETLQREPVQLLLSDQQMPGMSGVDLLKLARVRHPRVVRMMLTGSRDPETPVRSINEGEVHRFIRKPWSNAELRATVDLAFEKLRREEQERRRAAQPGDPLPGSASDADPIDVELEILALAQSEIEEG